MMVGSSLQMATLWEGSKIPSQCPAVQEQASVEGGGEQVNPRPMSPFHLNVMVLQRVTPWGSSAPLLQIHRHYRPDPPRAVGT